MIRSFGWFKWFGQQARSLQYSIPFRWMFHSIPFRWMFHSKSNQIKFNLIKPNCQHTHPSVDGSIDGSIDGTISTNPSLSGTITSKGNSYEMRSDWTRLDWIGLDCLLACVRFQPSTPHYACAHSRFLAAPLQKITNSSMVLERTAQWDGTQWNRTQSNGI